MSGKYDTLRLKNQLCFPVYLCAKEIVNRYAEPLSHIDLSYTQYVIMMYMWEKEEATAKQLSDSLLLDQSTITPLLKKLEAKGYIKRCRSCDDGRSAVITLTEKGYNLQDEALCVPEQMKCCIGISEEEAIQLYKITQKIICNIRKED